MKTYYKQPVINDKEITHVIFPVVLLCIHFIITFYTTVLSGLIPYCPVKEKHNQILWCVGFF